MCCHPALTSASAIALTLRAVGGLTTAEIAKAFLVPEATMAQRISRAKQSIKTSGVPFACRRGRARERLGAVLHVLYLIFNEGYTSSAGPSLHRTDLSNEAIRLTRDRARLLPDDGEVGGLLALMLLTDARAPRAHGADGELIPLDEQDRTLWDREAIAEGVALDQRDAVEGRGRRVSAAGRDRRGARRSARAEDTDWPQILALYACSSGCPTTRWCAQSRDRGGDGHGPARASSCSRRSTGTAGLAGHHRLDAVRAHLLEMAGDHQAAIELLQQAAAARTTSIPERNYLMARPGRLGRGIAIKSARVAIAPCGMPCTDTRSRSHRLAIVSIAPTCVRIALL